MTIESVTHSKRGNGTRFLYFIATAFAASIAFGYIYGKFAPIASFRPLAAATLLSLALSFLFGLWSAKSNSWLKLGSVAASVVIPFPAVVTLIFATCYIGPECM